MHVRQKFNSSPSLKSISFNSLPCFLQKSFVAWFWIYFKNNDCQSLLPSIAFKTPYILTDFSIFSFDKWFHAITIYSKKTEEVCYHQLYITIKIFHCEYNANNLITLIQRIVKIIKINNKLAILTIRLN